MKKAVQKYCSYLKRAGFQEDLKELKNLNLDPKKLIAVGSATLYEQVPGFRTPADLDFVFHPSLLPAMKELESKGIIQKKGTTGRKAQVWKTLSGKLEFGPDVEGISFDEFYKRSIPSSYGGYLLAPIDLALEAKRRSGRPKDFEDIETINRLKKDKNVEPHLDTIANHIRYLALKQAEIRQTVPRRHEALTNLGLSSDAIKDLAEVELFIQSLRDHPVPLNVHGPDEEWVKEHMRRSFEIDKRLIRVLDGLEEAGKKEKTVPEKSQ